MVALHNPVGEHGGSLLFSPIHVYRDMELFGLTRRVRVWVGTYLTITPSTYAVLDVSTYRCIRGYLLVSRLSWMVSE
jgi:hypothetical protein